LLLTPVSGKRYVGTTWKNFSRWLEPLLMEDVSCTVLCIVSCPTWRTTVAALVVAPGVDVAMVTRLMARCGCRKKLKEEFNLKNTDRNIGFRERCRFCDTPGCIGASSPNCWETIRQKGMELRAMNDDRNKQVVATPVEGNNKENNGSKCPDCGSNLPHHPSNPCEHNRSNMI